MRLICCSVLAIVASSSAAWADSFGVNVLNRTFSTTVSNTISRNNGDPALQVTRTRTSTAPVSDALVREGVVGARAEADYFGVLATTRSEVLPSGDYLRSALADATTRITFSPVQSGFASLLLELTTGTTSSMWSEGTIALRNLTTSEELWNYGWDSVGSGSIWRPHTYGTDLFGSVLFGAPLMVNTAFLASDQYLLTIYARTQAAGDRQFISLDVTGLHSVPEPGSMLLVTASLVGLGVRRWRTRSSRNRSSQNEAVL